MLPLWGMFIQVSAFAFFPRVQLLRNDNLPQYILDRRVAKCQNYTFDGVFRYKSSSMLIHLYIGWALAYGWMTCLLLLHKGILGHFMQKITKKVCFLGFPSRKFIF